MNAELRRYAWLELGLHRMVAAPLVIALLAAVVANVADDPASIVANAALTAFIVVTIGWGTMRAYASVVEEVQERTWDFQRMSALDPRELAWGKVFGAPVFAWYIGAWCLALYIPSALRAGATDIFSNLVLAIASAVLLHALCVAVSALAPRAFGLRRSRRMASIGILLALLWGLPMLVAQLAGGRSERALHWWFLHGWSMRGFAALSAVLFAGWALFAAWRAMARELREPPWWWGWPAFAAFLAFWWAGLGGPDLPRAGPAPALSVAALVLVVAGYLGLSLDPLTPVSWARLLRQATQRETPWHARVPLWLVHGGIALALALLAVMLSGGGAARAARGLGGVGPAVVLGLALMLLRDAAIVTAFTLTTASRRPVPLATFYIVLADFLLPALFGSLHQPALARALFPFWGFTEHPLYPAAGMALHVLLVGAVLAWRVLRLPGSRPSAQ